MARLSKEPRFNEAPLLPLAEPAELTYGLTPRKPRIAPAGTTTGDTVAASLVPSAEEATEYHPLAGPSVLTLGTLSVLGQSYSIGRERATVWHNSIEMRGYVNATQFSLWIRI